MSTKEPIRLGIVCGYETSKHGLALIHELSRMDGVQLVLVACVKTFTLNRIFRLIRRYGRRDALEKFKNVFFQSEGNRFEDEIRPVQKFLDERKIKHRTVRSASRSLKLKYLSVDSLENPLLSKCVSDNAVDILVYSGGGIVRTGLLKSVRTCVINAHSGPLPYFRGMNGMEWALLHGVRPEVTVHCIDKGVDTGPILYRCPIDMTAGDTIQSLRGRSVVVEVRSLLYTLQHFDELFQARKVQEEGQGKQFFVMHRFLKELLAKRLSLGWVPAIEYSQFRHGK